MKGIGGNITAAIQLKTTTKNQIGESVPTWATIQSLTGWLDMISGDSKYISFNTKIQESSHIFVGDYVSLDNRIEAEKCRVLINSKIYDIMLIDNPMEMNQQLEIYLKYTGGQ